MEKRISARAVIIEDGKIFLMYRRTSKRKYYAFPGGKQEEGETLEECVIREIKEELGIDIVPQKLIYEYTSWSSKQYYFLCTYAGGIFGTGEGEEFQKNDPNNYYEPRQENLARLKRLSVQPFEVKLALSRDLENGSFYKSNYFKKIEEKERRNTKPQKNVNKN